MMAHLNRPPLPSRAQAMRMNDELSAGEALSAIPDFVRPSSLVVWACVQRTRSPSRSPERPTMAELESIPSCNLDIVSQPCMTQNTYH